MSASATVNRQITPRFSTLATTALGLNGYRRRRQRHRTILVSLQPVTSLLKAGIAGEVQSALHSRLTASTPSGHNPSRASTA
jgi:hypothetical protein